MKKPKGVVIILTLGLIVTLLIMAGLAVDIAALVTARNELHRATDAASLAGAGKLGFDSSVFPTVRANAVAYGANNPTPYGAISLNPNDSNAPGGDVVLGIWIGAAFTPSLDGTQVNAVLCRTRQAVPTTFLRVASLLGASLDSITVSAQSIAVANPPNSLPVTACMFPIGVTTCQFENAGAFTSQGCGTAMTFISSSGKLPNTQAGTNTAAWINPNGTGTPSAADLKAWLAAANAGTGCTSGPVAGASVGATNGMIQPALNDMEKYFKDHYAASQPYTIKDAYSNVVYSGQGWEIYVPLIETACPPMAINKDVMIQTFAKFVITQVINNGNCAVNNPADANSYSLCPPPFGTAPKDPSLRGIFGYFECDKLDTTPTPIPAPRAALATRLRLVQ